MKQVVMNRNHRVQIHLECHQQVKKKNEKEKEKEKPYAVHTH